MTTAVLSLRRRGTRNVVLAAAAAAALVASFDSRIRAQEDTGEHVQAPPAPTPSKRLKVKPRARRAEAVSAAASSRREAELAPLVHVCVIDQRAVDLQAAADVASNKRLADLRAAAQSEIDAAKRQTDEQVRTIVGELRLRPTEVALKQQRQALDEQSKRLVAQANLYSREIEATRELVTRQLHSATMPLVQAIAKESACSIVITRDAVIEMEDAVDISRPVIDAMNAKLQFHPFSLVNIKDQ